MTDPTVTEPGAADPGAIHSRTADPTAGALRRRQFALLLGRYRPEDVICVQVVTDYYQHVATTAKSGRADTAAAQWRILRRDVPIPDAPELRYVVELASLPAAALIHFAEGDHRAARELLVQALDVAAELAARYGHDYLTGKRLHLAANLVRVTTTEGRHEAAAALLADLGAVTRGEPDRWQFTGATTLDVPLPEDVGAFIHAQLRREADRLAEASR